MGEGSRERKRRRQGGLISRARPLRVYPAKLREEGGECQLFCKFRELCYLVMNRISIVYVCCGNSYNAECLCCDEPDPGLLYTDLGLQHRVC